jgi:cytidine deaminase
MAFAHVVQALRHNPEKGPGVVYVSDNNDLISYAAANFWLDEMKPSEKLQRKHLTYPDGRSALNICAEPAAIAKVVGHEALGTARVLRSTRSKDDGHALSNSDFIPASRMPERRTRFLEKVSQKGRKSGAFENATLVTTADPCGSCTQAVVDVGIALVISDAETHHHPMSPKRMDEMKNAERTLSNSGVAHRHVHYVNNL